MPPMAVAPEPVTPEAVEEAVRSLVRALLRVMILELNLWKGERRGDYAMTESERHALIHGHRLANGCCRYDRR